MALRFHLTRFTWLAMALAMTAVAAGCAPPEPPDTRAQDEAAIRAAEAAWSTSINTKNVDTFVANYAPDAVVMPPNAPLATGAEPIRTAISAMLAAPGLDMTFQTSSVKVARSGDMAVTYGTYQLSITGPDNKPIQDKGKYVTVWMKQGDGSWKASVDMFNSNLPMPSMEPPLAMKKK